MKINFVLVAGCLALAGCSGRKADSELRALSPGHHSDCVALWVSNRSLHSAAKRPRIIEARVFHDGVESAAKPAIAVHNSKYGWTERVEFPADGGASTARIVATVESRGRRYTVTQDWTRSTDPPAGTAGWKPAGSSVTLLEGKGTGK